MAEHEPDGVNETFQAAARVAITAGGVMAERIMRAREQAMRDAQAVSEQHARELQARMDSERAAARSELRPVRTERWWDEATAEQMGVAWETANAWRDVDRDAAATVDHMRDQLRGRYAIEPDSLDADPGAVQDALERRERALRLASEARAQARREETVAASLLVSAGVADRDQDLDRTDRDRDPDRGDDEARAAALYDSAEARRDAAVSLEGVVDDETIEARVVADTSQARPAQEAVSSTPGRPPAARRSRGKGSQTRMPARRADRGR
ncbi:MAG: hypothetical protein LC777_12755 [Actinobacteria bacterium]|nr:hypothetical protein [Actinomycetota bacterium]